MALNDLNFSIHRRSTSAVWLLFVVAGGFVAVAVTTGEQNVAIFAILPTMIALLLLSFRPAPIEGWISDVGIELIRPPMLIPFETIREIEAEFDPDEPPPPSFRIYVHHPRGLLKFPEAPDINAVGIYEILLSRFQISGTRAINPILTDYLVEHERTFGPERVWSFTADTTRKRSVDVHKPRYGIAVGLGVLTTAMAWFASAAMTGGEPWGGAGVLAFVVGLFILIIASASRSGSTVTGIKKWQYSSLVISPVGLAMIQGDIQGQLPWDQLLDVKFKARGKGFRLSDDAKLHAITLIVEGAKILIADIYDRPLDLIYGRIVRYWHPERLETPVDL